MKTKKRKCNAREKCMLLSYTTGLAVMLTRKGYTSERVLKEKYYNSCV